MSALLEEASQLARLCEDMAAMLKHRGCADCSCNGDLLEDLKEQSEKALPLAQGIEAELLQQQIKVDREQSS